MDSGRLFFSLSYIVPNFASKNNRIQKKDTNSETTLAAAQGTRR
jgi:hypothetical protein